MSQTISSYSLTIIVPTSVKTQKKTDLNSTPKGAFLIHSTTVQPQFLSSVWVVVNIQMHELTPQPPAAAFHFLSFILVHKTAIICVQIFLIVLAKVFHVTSVPILLCSHNLGLLLTGKDLLKIKFNWRQVISVAVWFIQPNLFLPWYTLSIQWKHEHRLQMKFIL